MRILQVIDSLNPGGAEKMAVNFANEWLNHAEESFLIATNRDGVLRNQIKNKVKYKVYNRKKWNTFFVVIQILFFIKKNKIDYIQAHTSSYKWVKIIKLFFPEIKFYWHDHNGNRLNWPIKKNNEIIRYSKYFDGAICCNLELLKWAKKNLKTSACFYIPNFTVKNGIVEKTLLKGDIGKRIVCVANWREPKNHLMLVESFYNSKISELGWSLHLIGNIYNDEYFNEVMKFITDNEVNNVFIYGVCSDIENILSQAEIGVLVSSYEGFPLSLIEYGLAGVCPIVTNVGYMPTVVDHLETGFVIENDKLLLENMFKQLPHTDSYKYFGIRFNEKIIKQYSPINIVGKLKIYFEGESTQKE